MAQTEVALAVFLLIALLASIISKKIKTPYTTLLVLVGLALAVSPVPRVGGVTTFFNSLASEGLFIGLVLPPLLFESFVSIRASDFKAVYRPSLILATFGVIVSALVVGTVLWKVLGLDPLVSFLFAALISPTDVATVLEIFARVKVPSRLAALIEVESVFNDATGIALFTIVLTTAAAVTLQPFRALAEFAYVLGGGVLVGLGVALLARYIQRFVHDSVSQAVLTLVAVYGSYGLATIPPPPLAVSGIIAVAVTSLFYGNATIKTLESKEIAQTTREFWRILAFIANAVAFFFIGVNTNLLELAGSVGAFVVAFGVVVMARITSVYPILSITKVGGSTIPLSWMNTTALGGMRGAVAIVLVSAIPTDAAGTRGAVATLTFGVVMLSILLQGPLLTRYTQRYFGRQETLGTFEGETGAGESPGLGEALSPEPKEAGQG